jgi:tetratricopeptide (TPR) repeat protein
MKTQIISVCLLLLLISPLVHPCTIISGIDKNGVVWAGNNEDYEFDFQTYLNILPAEQKLFGAITFTYDRPDSFIQGGINEAGLFFDYNALQSVPVSNYAGWNNKKDFPAGDNGFNKYILQHCSSTKQVIDLLKEYRLPALLSSQLHVADQNGNLAVIDPDGIHTDKSYQVSTNFNVYSKASSAQGRACWRFPIAAKLLREQGVSLENFREILNATQQSRYYGTIYSNIANLSTGDIYFYYAGDFGNPYHFRIKDMLNKGKRSYPMRTLFPDSPIVKVWNVYQTEGAQKAVAEFEKLTEGCSEKRRSEILRHLFQNCLMLKQKFADAKIFFNQWLKLNEDEDPATNFTLLLLSLRMETTNRQKCL